MASVAGGFRWRASNFIFAKSILKQLTLRHCRNAAGFTYVPSKASDEYGIKIAYYLIMF